MDDDEQLTADDLAALDAQRSAPEPDVPVQDAPEAPEEGSGAPEAVEGAEPPVGRSEPQAVPYERFKEANERRKEVERQAAEDRRKWEARFEEVLKLVPQQAQAQPEPAAVIPDVQADPVGHIVGTLQQLGASQEQIRQAVATQQTQTQQQQLRDAVVQRSTAMEADYAAKNPEYNSAVQYLRDFRTRQLAAFGMDAPQIAQQIAAETLQIAASELQRGGNPAERLHRLAEASGWSASTAPPPAGQAAAAPDQATRIRMAQQGQEHSRGLGGVRGNGPSPMTAAKLMDIPDDDPEAVIKAMRSLGARKLMGA